MKNSKRFLALFLALIISMSAFALASAEDVFIKTETEDNGSVAGANLIQMQQMEGILDSSTDSDYFKFTIATAGILNLTFDHTYVNSADSYFKFDLFKLVETTPGTKTEVKLYSFYSAGNQSDDKDTTSGALKGVGKVVAPKCSLAVPATGEYYYIRISSGTVSDASVKYNIAYSVDESSFCEKEPNDTPENANSIVPLFDALPANASGYYTGMLGPNNDPAADSVDYFCINTTTPCYIYFGIKHDTTTTAAVKASYKVEVLSYDVMTGGVYSSPTTLGSFNLSRDNDYAISPSIGVGAGTFFFKITNTTADYGVYQLFSYYKQVSDAIPVESEPNSRADTADIISNTSKIYGSNLDSTDVDWYTVSVTSGEDFTMKFECIDLVTVVARWTVEVYDHGTNTIVGTFYPTSEKAETFALPKGTAARYDIKVTSSVNLADPADYAISFTHVTHEKDKTFLDKIKSLDFSALLEAFGFMGNFNWKEILPSLGKQLVKIVVFMVGMFN